jgi:Pectate lyase superfamily protein
MRWWSSKCTFWCAFSIFARAVTPDPCTPPDFPVPQFKPQSFNVRDFGATGNGRDNDTPAINRAIEKCTASGGGDVVFPKGTYLAASIHLQSNVRLMLDKDAVITGANSGYDPPEPNAFEKYQDFGHSHFHNALMWGEKIDNFAIVGGRINGGGIIEGDDADARDVGDKVIAIKSGRNLLFDGITHETGGHFVYLLNDCEQVTLASIVVKKTRDAVNLVSCRNVQMHDCNFTGCGDDSLALKSDYALGRKIESANIYVWNCYFETAANALQFGAESVGNFRNINFWNVRIGRAWKAGIGMRSADGAIIDGVTYRDVSMKQADTPISITVGHRLLSGEADRKVGAIKNIRVSNLSVADQRPRVVGVIRPSLIAGLPESPIENVFLEHVRIIGSGGFKRGGDSPANEETGRRREVALAAAGLFIKHARNVGMQDVDLSYNAADPRPSLIAHEVAGLTLEDVRLQRFSNSPLIRLKKVDKLQIARCADLPDQTLEHLDATEK